MMQYIWSVLHDSCYLITDMFSKCLHALKDEYDFLGHGVGLKFMISISLYAIRMFMKIIKL